MRLRLPLLTWLFALLATHAMAQIPLGITPPPNPSTLSMTIGSTSIFNGTNTYVLYNNNGTLGNVSPTITINSTACTLGSTCTVAGNNAITALSGDATATGPGSVAITLATVNSNVGTFQGLTVNGKGLVTAAGPGEVDLGTGMLTQTVTNSGTVGTATGLLAKLTSTGARTILTSDTAIANLLGVCVSGCSTSGSALVGVAGSVQAQFDGSTTAGDFVVASTTSAGKVHDAGATLPTSVNVVGFAGSTNVGAGTYTLNINPVGTASATTVTAKPGGTSGQIQWNNAGAFAGFTMSGDCTTVTSTGVITCGKTGGVAFAASATTDTTNANNITTGTLSMNRFNGGTGCSTSTYLRGDGTCQTPAGAGTVTSVALSMPSGFTVGGSPVTTTGTLAVTLASESASYVLIAPSGGSGTPTWRAITAADISGLVGTGTVTSVGLTMPGVFSVAGSPISTNGTLAVTASGTSGGIPYFASSTTMASSAALTANLPVFGGGAGAAPFVGTRSGNTTQVATVSGALTSGDCIKVDASGNLVDYGSGCGTAGTVTNEKCVTWDSTTAVTAQTVDFPVEWATYTITSVKAKVAGGGSFTYAIQIGGSAVTSCNVVTVNSSSNVNTTCTAANTGSANDIISMVIASPTGTVNQAYVCPVFTHTVN